MASAAVPNANRLRDIKTFPSLVKYLHEELDWPVGRDSFDDLTYDFELEELGIDPKNSAKIESIKQLKPLTDGQPWGIFFIKFEPKSLPIVALRRILSGLVIKRRQSGRYSDRAVWQLHDLLFISSYGDSDHTEMTFAHFSEEPELGDLPTLRVLGWDEDNASERLKHTDSVLRQKLCWPKDDRDLGSWRSQWSEAFSLRPGEVIRTAQAMAERLAELATKIRKRVNEVLHFEHERGQMRSLYAAFKQALIHDLSLDDFADMYAQTICYGLLTARFSRPAGLIADNLKDMVPPSTNPFLRELLGTFLKIGGRKDKLDFDELGITEVVQILRAAKMEEVKRDFFERNPDEDPTIRFYEDFLKQYDPKKRTQRGVFYTPQPVVSYIVRSVHQLLQTEFGLPEGLASTATWGEMSTRNPSLKIPAGTRGDSPFVQILDPAVGTGTFLVEVIEIVYRTMRDKWEREGRLALEIPKLWNEYVSKHLLPRLHGYELMMAPYAIAHMKIGLKLGQTGYQFADDERARIYLTNSLEPASDDKKQQHFEELAPALAHEAKAVNAIKRRQRFTVVIGNPPYSKSSQNQGQWIEDLMEEYKRTVRTAETQIQALSDDYAKFLRLGHFLLQQSHAGILGYITNNGYLDGPLFRDMRSSMLSSFDHILLLNLHGDSRKQFTPPDGKADENVFDIQQGVAISVLLRKGGSPDNKNTIYSEIWGTREERYRTLQAISANDENRDSIQPSAPFFLFVPVAKDLEVEFQSYWHLYDVYGTGNRELDNHESYGAGFVTQQDKFAIASCSEDMISNVRDFLEPKTSKSSLWMRFDFCSTDQWNFDRAKKELKNLDIRRLCKRCLYRPFDYRFTVFDRNICTIVRRRITFQFYEKNIGLLTTRRVTRLPYNNVFVTNIPAEYKVASHDRNTIVFPLWIAKDDENGTGKLLPSKRRLNLNPEFLSKFTEKLGLPKSKSAEPLLPDNLSPESVIYYAYAVFHSPTYRARYAEFLKIDFPRVPLSTSMQLFRALACLGAELVALHVMESPKLQTNQTELVGSARPAVEKVWHEDKTVWLDKKKTSGFQGVSEDVWNFHIGGYQICEKWLKDRKGRKLLKDDVDHYQRIVVALAETIRLMKEIDVVIDKHGGWPKAFFKQDRDYAEGAEARA